MGKGSPSPAQEPGAERHTPTPPRAVTAAHFTERSVRPVSPAMVVPRLTEGIKIASKNPHVPGKSR